MTKRTVLLICYLIVAVSCTNNKQANKGKQVANSEQVDNDEPVDAKKQPDIGIDIGLEDLGIIAPTSDVPIMLDDSFAIIRPILGEPRYTKIVINVDGEKNDFDEFRHYYDGLTIYHFRGFNETIILMTIFDSQYQTLAGVSVGDTVEDIETAYKNVRIGRARVRNTDTYIDRATVTIEHDDTEKGFVFTLGESDAITEIKLLIFAP